jgi:ribonucleoside-diphosphate reductase alpha subunit
MRVQKRNGVLETVSFDKVLNRISKLCVDLSIDPSILAQQVCGRIYDTITTTELDEFASSLSASMSLENLDYEILASRIIISNHHKNTDGDYLKVVTKMQNFLHPKYVEFVTKHIETINRLFDYDRDYLFDYFGFKTLEKGRYLYKCQIENKTIERPQHMLMREAIGIHSNEFEDERVFVSIKETYDLLSFKKYTHATPTLFNAGTKRPQLSSCFLLDMQEDSIEGIYDTLKDCALISKEAGGIGLAVHKVRSKNSEIKGTNGVSNGLVPMLKVFNETAKYVDQCVHPDTNIYTTSGVVKIKNCSIQETQVFNMSGKAERIHDVLEHAYNGEILHISTSFSPNPLIVTPEHPILSLKNPFVGNVGLSHEQKGFYISNGIEKGTLGLDFLEAKMLQKGDYFVYSIPMNSDEDLAYINEMDCFIYGCILAKGELVSADYFEDQAIMYQGCIDVCADNKKLVDFIKNYFDSRAVLCNLVEKKNKDRSLEKETTRVLWIHSTNLPFRYNDIFGADGEKCIYKKWLNLSREKLANIVCGFFQCVGFQDDESMVFEFDLSARCYNLSTMNINLCNSLQFLLLKLGIYSSLSLNLDGFYSLKVLNTRELQGIISQMYPTVGTDLPTHEGETDFFKIIQHDLGAEKISMEYILVPIETICGKLYKGLLYDLQMELEHNYMLQGGGIVHNGGGKRKGSFSIYLEPWHPDIQEFLELKKSRGSEELRARDLFYALWIPDLFMKRVKEEKMWTLFSPSLCPGLHNKWGKEFEELYCAYEAEYPESRKIYAQDLWRQILNTCVETGGPSILFKDHCNGKSNHQHLGTIQSSNLCTEIIQYSDPTETAVCNLASICLPNFVDKNVFDFKSLRLVVHKIVENLNRVIDVNYYPTEKCRKSNQRHRPIGIGVQGMADMFYLLDLSWEDSMALQTNKNIFEVIYYSALEKSCELAQKYGPYESYKGSPLSLGIFQFNYYKQSQPSGVGGICNWEQLKSSIMEHGCRNSLLVAPMPTASTSQIMGFSECFEPYTSNIFVRRTNAGEFKMLNKHMLKKLREIGVWNSETKNRIMLHEGSIQWMDDSIHPNMAHIKALYKTIWEMKHKLMIDFSAERASFIDQSQSFNVYMEDPSIAKLNSAYFYSWEKGLKTCQYYLRIRTKAKAIQFTVDPSFTFSGASKVHSDGSGKVGDTKASLRNSFGMLSRSETLRNSKDSVPNLNYNRSNDGETCSRDNPNCLSCGS